MVNKKVKIGNEHFKEWLRMLDPHTRVKHLSNVGRSLYAMGARGTSIQVSMARMSQGCCVMLKRLSENEIKYYTRRKPLPKLQHLNHSSHMQQHEYQNNSIASSNVLENKSLCFEKDNGLTSSTEQQERGSPTISSLSTRDSIDLHSKIVKKSLKRQKKKELLKQLFGEDDTNDSSTKKAAQTSGHEAGEKEVNSYLSTTVNFNYYNIYNTPTNETCDLKRKSYADKSFVKSSNAEKKLRIHVSLPNNELLNEEFCSSDIHSMIRKKSSKLVKRKNSAKKVKKTHKKSSNSVRVNNSEEDPSIAELWQILGMESPTDRKAKLLSSQLNLSASETVKINGDVGKETDPNKNTSLEQFKSKTSSIPVIDSLQEPCTKPKQSKASLTKSKHPIQCDNAQEVVEPFLKISETFTLSDEGTSERKINNRPNDGNQTIIKNRLTDEVICLDQNNVSCPNPEDIVISVDEDYHVESKNVQNQKSNSKSSNCENDRAINSEVKSKVGTIRVKSFGLLKDPQVEKNNFENTLTLKTVQGSTNLTDNVPISNQSNCFEDATRQSLDERLFHTYVYYFDELVEAKIPKLGELLHLAIADGMRFTERIKRADQLSSEDLIKEEKNRAFKDFNELMKVRGVEFTPLCDLIVKKFDQGSKVTLFLVLFCRMLKHAATIDPANEGFMFGARKVIVQMLRRQEYKDKEIMESLNMSDFEAKIKRIQDIFAKFISKDDKIDKISIDNKSHNNSTCNAQTSVKALQKKRNNHSLSIKYNSIANNSVNSRENHQPLTTQHTNLNNQFQPPKTYGPAQNIGINHLQAFVARENANGINIANNVNSLNRKDGRYYKPKPQLEISCKIPPDQGVIKQNKHFHQVKSNQIERNTVINHQLTSHTIVSPQITSRTVDISSPVTFSLPVSKSPSNSSTTTSTFSRASAVYPPQNLICSTITNPEQPNRLQFHPNILTLTPANVVSMTNVKTTSTPQLPTVTPARSCSQFIPVLNGRENCSTIQPQRFSELNQLKQRPNPKPVEPSVPIIIRNVVDDASSAIVGINPNQLRVPELHEETLATDRREIPPTTTVPSTAAPVPEPEMSPEVTTPPSEMNLPSSSHCHPFIARRPISGKMKMLFGNTSHN